MRYYLLRPNNTWSDLADYPGTPDARDDGAWVAGEPVGLEPMQFLSLSDKLAQILDSQDLQVKVEFASLRAAIHLELQLGHLDVVEAIVEQTLAPTELEPLKQQMLAILQEGQ